MKVAEAIDAALSRCMMHRSTEEIIASFLASLRASGFEIVPRDATEKMQAVLGESATQRFGAKAIWRAMLAAAKESDDG